MKDKFRGCILGLACGDALGMPTEFRKLDAILQAFGPDGIQDLPEPALFTDDTQMAIAVAEALCAGGNDPLPSLAQAMAREFIDWMDSPENNRSPGIACMRGCARLKGGVSWQESGLRESKGCGANMRVAPVGLRYWDDPARLQPAARMSAMLTHAHPTALAAAEATALCVAWAVQGQSPETYLDQLDGHSGNTEWDEALGFPWGENTDPSQAMRSGWEELVAVLRRVPPTLQTRPADYCEHIGQAWVAEEALGCALYCVCAWPEDYVAAVRLGANSNGDSDSIACIAGAISGAYLGESAIPEDWRGRIEKAPYLAGLADRLLDAATPG